MCIFLFPNPYQLSNNSIGVVYSDSNRQRGKMAQPYPLCPSPSASSFSFHSRIPFFTIVPSHSKTLLHAPRFSLQPVNTLQDAKLDDPDAKSPSLSKNSIWVNPRSPRAKHLQNPLPPSTPSG